MWYSDGKDSSQPFFRTVWRRFFVLTKNKWGIFLNFDNTKTVPAKLCLRHRRNPPFSNQYNTILNKMARIWRIHLNTIPLITQVTLSLSLSVCLCNWLDKISYENERTVLKQLFFGDLYYTPIMGDSVWRGSRSYTYHARVDHETGQTSCESASRKTRSMWFRVAGTPLYDHRRPLIIHSFVCFFTVYTDSICSSLDCDLH